MILGLQGKEALLEPGSAMAASLPREGAAVAVADVNRQAVEATVDAIASITGSVIRVDGGLIQSI